MAPTFPVWSAGRDPRHVLLTVPRHHESSSATPARQFPPRSQNYLIVPKGISRNHSNAFVPLNQGTYKRTTDAGVAHRDPNAPAPQVPIEFHARN